MARDLVDRLKSFSLSIEEKDEILLEKKDIIKRKEESERSLIGKLYGEKRVNFVGFRSTVSAIWQTKERFTVREVGVNLYQFIFFSQEDKIRVLRGKTWSFDGLYLVLKEWAEDILEKTDQLNSVELWVQVWNLPYFWIGVETGRKIGKKFDNILDVLVPETGSSKGMFIKILVVVNLDKPLLRGAFITLNSEKVWVDFRYENLQSFCFYCGMVGHLERGCSTRREDIRLDKLEEGQFGEWLRVSEVRRNKFFSKYPKDTTPLKKPSPVSDENSVPIKSGVDVLPQVALVEDNIVESLPEKVGAANSIRPIIMGGLNEGRVGVSKGVEATKEMEANPIHMEVFQEDWNKENVMLIDKQDMVDVVILMEGNRTPFKEIQNNVIGRGGKSGRKRNQSRRGGRGKWEGSMRNMIWLSQNGGS
ncbi:hypothetical protein DH2020_003498 [Rehmannia glutinosa]|uniref:CCHC-type domain-containing protein n=1 Tax=Rehmannia glutinosa TaxID=99300 RepID=A0ABR0XLT9_REHGL